MRDYRNRARVDIHTGGPKWAPDLFVWDEVFYYSKYDAWTRNRMAAGGRKTIGKRVVGNVYFQREDNQISSPAHINTIALLVEVRVR